jgi:hypothetical protein
MWQRRAIACERVRQLGLQVTWRQYPSPKTVEELAKLLQGDSAFVRCDADYEAFLYRDPCSRWEGDDPDGRVVRLWPASPRIGAAPQAASSPDPAPVRTRPAARARRGPVPPREGPDR